MPVLLGLEEAPAELAARLSEIAARKGRALLALDGMAAAGKTTLAGAVAGRVPGCFVVHMDDFFLTEAQRRSDLYARTLAFADVERVYAEVLAPLLRGEDARYRPYVHHPEPKFLPPVRIPADCRALIVEGAYALAPALWDAYDVRALATVSGETQRERIVARSGEALLPRFLSEWIPMENRHIAARRLAERCDVLVVTP